MDNPRSGVIGHEANRDVITLGITSIDNISLNRVQEVEITTIGTPNNVEGVLSNLSVGSLNIMGLH